MSFQDDYQTQYESQPRLNHANAPRFLSGTEDAAELLGGNMLSDLQAQRNMTEPATNHFTDLDASVAYAPRNASKPVHYVSRTPQLGAFSTMALAYDIHTSPPTEL